MFVLSHLVLWEDVSVCHTVVNQPDSKKNQKVSLSYRIPEGKGAENFLSTFKVNLWDFFATGLLIQLN